MEQVNALNKRLSVLNKKASELEGLVETQTSADFDFHDQPPSDSKNQMLIRALQMQRDHFQERYREVLHGIFSPPFYIFTGRK